MVWAYHGPLYPISVEFPRGMSSVYHKLKPECKGAPLLTRSKSSILTKRYWLDVVRPRQVNGERGEGGKKGDRNEGEGWVVIGMGGGGW